MILTDLIAQIAIAAVFALFGAGVTVLVTRRTRKTREPCWAIRSINLIRDHQSSLEGLAISYCDVPIQSLTVSRLVFLNRGQGTIVGKAEQGSDIVEDIEIVTKDDVEILNAKVLQTSNQNIEFSSTLAENNKSCALNFHHLQHEDGAVLEVIHTGTSSQDIEVKGGVRDVKQLRQLSTEGELPPTPPFWAFLRRRLSPTTARNIHLIYQSVFILVFLGPFAFLFIWASINVSPLTIGIDYVEFFVFGLVLFGLVVFWAWRAFITNSRALFPSALNIFYEGTFQEEIGKGK